MDYRPVEVMVNGRRSWVPYDQYSRDRKQAEPSADCHGECGARYGFGLKRHRACCYGKVAVAKESTT